MRIVRALSFVFLAWLSGVCVSPAWAQSCPPLAGEPCPNGVGVYATDCPLPPQRPGYVPPASCPTSYGDPASSPSGSASAAGGVALQMVVCGLAGVSGVQYVQSGGAAVSCGTDANGDALALQVSTTLVAVGGGSPDGSRGSGAAAGFAIGGAVLGVMALAFCLRLLRNFFNSSAEG